MVVSGAEYKGLGARDHTLSVGSEMNMSATLEKARPLLRSDVGAKKNC